MEVLAFLGSPRQRGNTEVLLDAVARGVERAGGRVSLFRLNRLLIQPCQNCGGCDPTGECILEDDMTALYDRIWAVKRVIVASPIYFYGVTAQTKTFVDRAQALWNRTRLLREKGEWHDDPERKGFFVSVAATRGPRVFEGAVLTVKYWLDAMGMRYGGDFLMRGVDEKGAMARHPDKLRDAETFGEKIVS